MGAASGLSKQKAGRRYAWAVARSKIQTEGISPRGRPSVEGRRQASSFQRTLSQIWDFSWHETGRSRDQGCYMLGGCWGTRQKHKGCQAC